MLAIQIAIYMSYGASMKKLHKIRMCIAIALEWIYNSYKIVHIATYTVRPNVLFPVAYASAYIHWYI